MGINICLVLGARVHVYSNNRTQLRPYKHFLSPTQTVLSGLELFGNPNSFFKESKFLFLLMFNYIINILVTVRYYVR